MKRRNRDSSTPVTPPHRSCGRLSTTASRQPQPQRQQDVPSFLANSTTRRQQQQQQQQQQRRHQHQHCPPESPGSFYFHSSADFTTTMTKQHHSPPPPPSQLPHHRLRHQQNHSDGQNHNKTSLSWDSITEDHGDEHNNHAGSNNNDTIAAAFADLSPIRKDDSFLNQSSSLLLLDTSDERSSSSPAQQQQSFDDKPSFHQPLPSLLEEQAAATTSARTARHHHDDDDSEPATAIHHHPLGLHHRRTRSQDVEFHAMAGTTIPSTTSPQRRAPPRHSCSPRQAPFSPYRQPRKLQQRSRPKRSPTLRNPLLRMALVALISLVLIWWAALLWTAWQLSTTPDWQSYILQTRMRVQSLRNTKPAVWFQWNTRRSSTAMDYDDTWKTTEQARALERRRRTRPPPMVLAADTTTTTTKQLLYQPQSQNPPPPLQRRTAASLESLCGLTAQSAALQNASYFPAAYALGRRSRVALIVQGTTAVSHLALALALQHNCQAHIAELVLLGQNDELDYGRRKTAPLYQQILQHQPDEPPLLVDHQDWTLRRNRQNDKTKHHHHHENTDTPITHVVYFASPISSSSLHDVTLSTQFVLTRLLQLPRETQLVMIESKDNSNAVSSWRTKTLQTFSRPNLLRVQLPVTTGSANEQGHLLEAILAVLQMEVAPPGLLVPLTTNQKNDEDATIAERYLGGWKPSNCQDYDDCETETTTNSEHGDSVESLLQRQKLSCASECLGDSDQECVPTIWPLELTREITEDCSVVLYTTIPFQNYTAEYRHPLSRVDLGDDEELTNRICNVAFVNPSHSLVELALQRVPNQQLLQFDIRPSLDIHQQKLRKLNGRLVYRGWILVWPDSAQEQSGEEWSLVKLTPAKLLSSTVQYAIYIKAHANSDDAAITLHDIKEKISNMQSPARKARLVEGGPNKNFILPREPHKRAILQIPRFTLPSSLQKKKLSVSVAIKLWLGRTIAHEPHDVRRHRELYHNLGKWVNSLGRRNQKEFEPVYRYDLKPFLFDTESWLVHDLTLDEARDLRCEWFQEHLPFSSSLSHPSMDALTLAHILSLRDTERRQAFSEPNDHDFYHLPNLEEMLELKDWGWMPLQTESNRVWSASRYRLTLAPWGMQDRPMALRREQEAIVDSSSHDNPHLFVRIM